MMSESVFAAGRSTASRSPKSPIKARGVGNTSTSPYIDNEIGLHFRFDRIMTDTSITQLQQTLQGHIDRTSDRFTAVDDKVDRVERSLSSRFDLVDKRFDTLDTTLGRIENRLAKLDDLATSVTEVKATVKGLPGWIGMTAVVTLIIGVISWLTK